MAPRERFHRNDWPTLGVEVELQLVDDLMGRSGVMGDHAPAGPDFAP